ncbi:38506_t:CDS:1, partial [Gigaspora margarita]
VKQDKRSFDEKYQHDSLGCHHFCKLGATKDEHKAFIYLHRECYNNHKSNHKSNLKKI